MLEVTMTSCSASTGRTFLSSKRSSFDWPHHVSRARLRFSWFPHNPSIAAVSIKVLSNNDCVALDAPEASMTVMEANEKDDFVDVGRLCGTHGVKGELKVMSVTDFPEKRFERPGMRWVGFYRMGRLMGLRKMNLLCGRKIMHGKDHSWLLTFEGVDSKDKALELVGATVLATHSDRPALDEDQFYIPELIGMSVRMKDSENIVGHIINVFDSGASHLLKVKTIDSDQQNQKGAKDEVVWIPFVKEIVPIINTEGRFVEITPPQGLLEMNAPRKGPVKKELKKQVLRDRRKLQDKMSGVRKKVLALKQEHILSGLVHGEESQRESLKAQLLAIDFTSFKRALETSLVDSNLSLDLEANAFDLAIPSPLDWKGLKKWLQTFPRDAKCGNEINEHTRKLWHRGLRLVSEGKTAIVGLFTGDLTDTALPDSLFGQNLEHQASQILAMQRLAEIKKGERPSIPWIIAAVNASLDDIENYLKNESYFGLCEHQVYFVNLSRLPYVSLGSDEAQSILMESQWRLYLGTGGDGQVIADLDDSGVLDRLMEMGVSYIHICPLKKSSAISEDAAIFGFMEEQNSCVGVKVTSDTSDGAHGILYLRKGSVDKRSRSIFISEMEKAAGSIKSIIDNFEHLVVSKPREVLKVGVLAQKENKQVYRVTSDCAYTLSAEYLRHLSQQRYSFVYEGETTEADSREAREVFQNNSMQLKCSLHNVLGFCSPSRVALFNCDGLID